MMSIRRKEVTSVWMSITLPLIYGQKNPQDIKILKKSYIMCMMSLSEFNFLFALLRWMKDGEKITCERKLSNDCASGKKENVFISQQVDGVFLLLIY